MVWSQEDLGKLVLRLSIGGLMLFHGIFKIVNGIGGIEGMLAAKGIPAIFAYGVYVGEVVVPLMLILGIKVRIAAGILIFNMLVAIYTVFGFNICALDSTGGWVIEHQLLYILPAVAIMLLGSGSYSLCRCLNKCKR